MAGEDDENWWIEEGISKEDVDFVNALVAAKVRQAPAEEMHKLMREAQHHAKTQGVEDFDEELFRLAFYVTHPGPRAPGEWFNWDGFWERYRKIDAGLDPDTVIGGGLDL